MKNTYSTEKVVALRKYVDIVKKAENSFTEQLEADIISIDEVREKKRANPIFGGLEPFGIKFP